jgi:hypothetical protein
MDPRNEIRKAGNLAQLQRCNRLLSPATENGSNQRYPDTLLYSFTPPSFDGLSIPAMPFPFEAPSTTASKKLNLIT